MTNIQRIFELGYSADQWLKFNYMHVFESLWTKDFMHYVQKYKHDTRLFSFYNKLDKINRVLLVKYLLSNGLDMDGLNDLNDLIKCLDITSYVCHNMNTNHIQRLNNNVYEFNVQCETFDLSGFLTSLNYQQQKEVCDEYSAYLYNK